jgi:predicted RNase H-like HicB family nuclease
MSTTKTTPAEEARYGYRMMKRLGSGRRGDETSFLLSGTGVSCYKMDMEIKLTAVFRKFPEGYAAFVEELPGANTQGATLEEARKNLKEAVAMVLQANRELALN